MRRYKNKKIYSWNSEIAYIAGLFASDGCLYKDGRHLNITSKDTILLEIVRTILNLKGNYKSKISGYGKVSYYVQFSDVALYDFLYNAGIKPAKSKSIGKLDIPDNFYSDFLRGYFDGDGCVYGFWDKRWKSSLMYYTEFASASPAFLQWLKSQNTQLAHTSSGRVKKSTRVSALSYAKKDSKLLFEFMYHDMSLPSLARKRTKFIDFLEADPYASKEFLGRVLESGRQATLRT